MNKRFTFPVLVPSTKSFLYLYNLSVQILNLTVYRGLRFSRQLHSGNKTFFPDLNRVYSRTPTNAYRPLYKKWSRKQIYAIEIRKNSIIPS